MIKTNFWTDIIAARGTYYLFSVVLNRPRHQHTIPLQVLGQGNGQVIASYTIVTSPAYNMLSKQGYVDTFTMAISGTKVSFHGTVFIDNNDGVITANFNNFMEEIAEQAQKGSVAEEAEMCPLGKTFQLDKMGCYLISFDFDKGEPSYLPDKP